MKYRKEKEAMLKFMFWFWVVGSVLILINAWFK